jgi:hypothetical protein
MSFPPERFKALMDAGGGGRVEGWTKREEDSKTCVQRPPGQEFAASPRFTSKFQISTGY